MLGTPGEDCGGGTKINMVSQGTFCCIDCCLMLAPLNMNLLYPKFYTLLVVKVSYKGKAAHASAFPWEGRNALDAAVACYNNIGLLRQQLKPTWSINGECCFVLKCRSPWKKWHRGEKSILSIFINPMSNNMRVILDCVLVVMQPLSYQYSLASL